MLRKARIVKGAEATLPLGAAGSPARSARARVIRKDQVEAHAAAQMIRSRALAFAEEAQKAAELAAAKTRQAAHEEGYAQGLAEAAARALLLSQLEADADARQLDRNVELATLLAERLLGKALELEPALVTALAQQALSEVRGASRVTLWVSPTDRDAIARALDGALHSQATVVVSCDDSLASGNFRLQTNIGTLDAALGSRLALLSEKLREGIKR